MNIRLEAAITEWAQVLADRPELRETIERLRGLAAALPRIRTDRVRPAEAREGPPDGS